MAFARHRLSGSNHAFKFLFSVHISYRKGKYLYQTPFFYKICQAPKLYLTLRVLPIKFNSQKISFVQFVFVEISRLSLVDPKDPGMTQKGPQK